MTIHLRQICLVARDLESTLDNLESILGLHRCFVDEEVGKWGLANTLLQTGFLRPKIKSKKVRGLYFTGQLTVPGPGVPPSLISGR